MAPGSPSTSAVYPASPAGRDRFVLERRDRRTTPDPWQYQNLIVEDERDAAGRIARVATVFLTGRECPWRCVMCDLWRSTTIDDTPAGAIPAQIEAARRRIDQETRPIAQVKLYNAGSFFDPHAVPETDYDAVGARLQGLERVIVESHPALIGDRVDRFLDALRAGPDLEVAMGLETVHPNALEHLHKRMTVDQFALASDRLRGRGVSLRVFLLINPPFVPADEQDAWLRRSLDRALECGATAVTMIPTRSGNGSLEALGDLVFREPGIRDIERSLDLALSQPAAARIFADLWDLERFAVCARCLDARRTRLAAMNLAQRVLPAVVCPQCDGDGS